MAIELWLHPGYGGAGQRIRLVERDARDQTWLVEMRPITLGASTLMVHAAILG